MGVVMMAALMSYDSLGAVMMTAIMGAVEGLRVVRCVTCSAVVLSDGCVTHNPLICGMCGVFGSVELV